MDELKQFLKGKVEDKDMEVIVKATTEGLSADENAALKALLGTLGKLTLTAQGKKALELVSGMVNPKPDASKGSMNKSIEDVEKGLAEVLARMQNFETMIAELQEKVKPKKKDEGKASDTSSASQDANDQSAEKKASKMMLGEEEVTVVKENDDGTVEVKLADGSMKNVKKDKLSEKKLADEKAAAEKLALEKKEADDKPFPKGDPFRDVLYGKRQKE